MAILTFPSHRFWVSNKGIKRKWGRKKRWLRKSRWKRAGLEKWRVWEAVSVLHDLLLSPIFLSFFFWPLHSLFTLMFCRLEHPLLPRTIGSQAAYQINKLNQLLIEQLHSLQHVKLVRVFVALA